MVIGESVRRSIGCGQLRVSEDLADYVRLNGRTLYFMLEE